uniref:Transmembrane protein n=1 Tax=Pediastrum duplex TaxID=3105 RepID=A0A2U8GIX4_PEDDU|nr:hypothetical protein [Pediastrum duplex]
MFLTPNLLSICKANFASLFMSFYFIYIIHFLYPDLSNQCFLLFLSSFIFFSTSHFGLLRFALVQCAAFTSASPLQLRLFGFASSALPLRLCLFGFASSASPLQLRLFGFASALRFFGAPRHSRSATEELKRRRRSMTNAACVPCGKGGAEKGSQKRNLKAKDQRS